MCWFDTVPSKKLVVFSRLVFFIFLIFLDIGGDEMVETASTPSPLFIIIWSKWNSVHVYWNRNCLFWNGTLPPSNHLLDRLVLFCTDFESLFGFWVWLRKFSITGTKSKFSVHRCAYRCITSIMIGSNLTDLTWTNFHDLYNANSLISCYVM